MSSERPWQYITKADAYAHSNHWIKPGEPNGKVMESSGETGGDDEPIRTIISTYQILPELPWTKPPTNKNTRMRPWLQPYR